MNVCFVAVDVDVAVAVAAAAAGFFSNNWGQILFTSMVSSVFSWIMGMYLEQYTRPYPPLI